MTLNSFFPSSFGLSSWSLWVYQEDKFCDRHTPCALWPWVGTRRPSEKSPLASCFGRTPPPSDSARSTAASPSSLPFGLKRRTSKSVQTPPHALLHPSHFTPCFKLCRSWKLAMPFTCQRSAENFAQKASVFQDLFAELWDTLWLLPKLFSVDNCPSSTAPGSRHTFNSFSHVKQAILPLPFLSGACAAPVLSPSLPYSNS